MTANKLFDIGQEYLRICDKLFYGKALTNDYLNTAYENLRNFLVKNNATPFLKKINIGIKIREQNGLIKSLRFVYLTNGNELNIQETIGIGHILRNNPYGLFNDVINMV